jgi:hypothetical protein
MLWASPAWWMGAENTLSPLATAYHSAARWATGLPPSTRISNLLTCAHLPPLHVYLDYLSTKFAIRVLFLPAGHSLAGIPTIPNRPTSAPGTSRLRVLIKHLITGNLENRLATPITFTIQSAPPIHTSKNDHSHIHHRDWISSLPIGTLLLYTDGSKLDSGKVGCGTTTYEIPYLQDPFSLFILFPQIPSLDPQSHPITARSTKLPTLRSPKRTIALPRP